MQPTVTIRNSSTGEVRQVPQQQLGNYGIQPQSSAPPSTPPQASGGGLADLLPLIGAIGGSFIGTPILGGAIGAGLGTLGKQLFNKQDVNPGEIVTEAGLAGAGGVGGKLLGGLLGKFLPDLLSKTGEGAIASQYNVPRNVARAINFPQSIKDLSQYGITDITKVPQAAEAVTGANGIVSKLTRAAVAKAQPVELGALSDTTTTPAGVSFRPGFETASGLKGPLQEGVSAGTSSTSQIAPSVMEMAQTLATNPSMTGSTAKRFINFIDQGLKNTMGGQAGNISGKANPSEVFNFIQQLEKQAAGITRGRAPSAITAEDKTLASAYKSVADELQSRLFGGSGGDAAVTQGLLTPDQFQILNQIHPQLAQNVANAKTVSELRGIAAPFVQANKAAAETNAASQFGFQNLAGQAKGAGKIVPSLANPLAPVSNLLSQPEVNAKIGGAALKGSQLLKNLPLPSSQVLQRTGVAGGAGLGSSTTSSPDQSSFNNQLPSSQTDTGQTSESPRDPLRTALGLYALQHAKSTGDMIQAFNLLNPKPANGTVDRAASLKVGENVVDNAMKTLTGYGPVQGRLYELQLHLGGGAGVPADVVKTSTAFNLLRQSVVRALQGARMSDADIRIAEGYTPSLTDTAQTVQQKLGVLKQILQETRQYLQTTNQQYYSPTTTNQIPLPTSQGGF